MYENKTYENILNAMLGRVPDEIDKREGSIIFDALAPAAYELAQAYFELDNFLKLSFIDTSEGEYLTRICSQFGVNRKAAVAAVKTGTFTGSAASLLDVPIGSRFGIDGMVYAATKKIADGTCEMTCETPGVIGNAPSGDLLPIDNIPGLATAILSSAAITPGSETETDASLKQRTLVKLQNPATSGSLNDYKIWASSIAGVGGVKVFPLWNGAGTVKVVLIDTDKKAAGGPVIAEVAEYIEQVRPIGATVTVEAAVEATINISVVVSRALGYTVQQVTDSIIAAVDKYLKTIAFMQTTVSYAQIGNVILDAAGVMDYSNLTINGGTSNIPLSFTAESCQTPVLGTVTVT